MSYALIMRKEREYLHIEITGDRTRATVVAVAKDCIAACKEHGYTRLLLDVQRMVGQLGTIEAYEVGREDLVQLRQGLGLKVAILDLENNRDRFQFLENVAVNAGIHLRIFSNINRAMNWLLGAKKPEGG